MMENRYDKYKDSGIAWIGEIPEHWEVRKGKNLFRLRISKGNNNAILLAATQKFGMIPQTQVEGVVQVRQNTDLNTFRTVHKNDYVISLRSFQGGFEMSEYEGVCSPAYQVFYSKTPCCNYFFKYLFKSYGFISQINAFTLGIREGKNIQYEDFSLMKLPLPTLQEQQTIAAYLDQKCGEIDELITLQEKMITKLQSYKQSVITEAVTKGLDKNVPLKDSGIEWIGEIPEHWKVIKIKNAFNIISGATPKTDNMAYWDGEITWITPADYNTEDKMISSSKRNITLAGLNSCGTSIVPEGSIIFSKRAPIGLVAINVVPLCTNQGCISCIPKPSVNTKYFYYLMSVLTDWFELFGSGTTFKELSTNNFANFILSQPPFSEQQAIADYLDQRCSEIDELISIKQQKIEKLKEYKKSLIFECVTGKRKVS